MSKKKYERVKNDNPRYNGLHIYRGKTESYVVFWKDQNGKSRTKTIGTVQDMTLEEAYVAKQKLLGKKPEPLEESQTMFDALKDTKKGKDFMDFYEIHGKTQSFVEVALAYLIIKK